MGLFADYVESDLSFYDRSAFLHLREEVGYMDIGVSLAYACLYSHSAEILREIDIL